MRSDERKYADLGKFEVVFTMLEEELGKCIERTSNNKGSAYDYIRRVLMRMDEEVPRGGNYRNFLSEVERTVRVSRADSEERDRTFFSGIMEKLKEELQTAVPNGDYESVDAKKIMEIAQQLLATIEKELKEKEKAEVSYGVKAPNGYFKKLQDEFEQNARRMLTMEEREEVAGYVRRMRGEAEELEVAENQGTETTLTNLTKLLDEFIAQQRQVEEYGNLGASNKIDPKNDKITMDTLLNNAQNPFDFDSYVVPNKMSTELEEALANAPKVDLDYVAPGSNDMAMEDISASGRADDLTARATEEMDKNGDLRIIERDGQKYVITKDAVYDEQGQLVEPGEIRTIEAMDPKTGYVVLPDESGTFNRVLTPEQFLEYHRTKTISRDNPEHNPKTNIGEMFL